MNKNNFQSLNNIFFSDNNLLINAPALITEFLVINSFVVLLIDSDELMDEKNIFCYSLNGQFEWQIEETVKLPGHFRNYYTSIYLNEKNDFQAFNLNGVETTIDLNTGKILKKELIK